MGKTKRKPFINMEYKKLIEVVDHGITAVICVACWRKRLNDYDKTYNRSSRDPYTGRYRYIMYELRQIGSVAPHEKVVCVDCGRKNENGKNGISWFNIWR